MYKTGIDYDGFLSSLTEVLLNKTEVLLNKPKKETKGLDEAVLKVAYEIFKTRHAAMKTRFAINVAETGISIEEKKKASGLEDQIKKYTENLESIFKKMNISFTEGSDRLLKMEDVGGENV